MRSRQYQCEEKKKTPSALNSIDSGMLQGRPLPTQLKTLSEQPDLKTSLSQAERYGHHLDKIQCATAPIQMLSSLEEEENKKLISDTNLNASNLSMNNHVLTELTSFTNELKSFNTNHEKHTNPLIKHDNDKITNTAKTSKAKDKDQNKDKDKHKDKEKQRDEHLTPPTNKNSEQKETEDSSSPQDPEVKKLLNKQTQDNLASSNSGAQKNNQEKNQEKFVAPPSIYNEKKSTPSPKVGTRGQYLAKREAMNMLGNNKEFAATQRAVKKVPISDASKSDSKADSKAEDSKHQIKLKNAAELVRDQIINEDRQVKEHLQGRLNIDPAIVAKQGGEQLILQKMQ